MATTLHIIILFSIALLAALVSANPVARPKPFPLPATYLAGGVSIAFEGNGTFHTRRPTPPLPCDDVRPECPGRTGQGHWSWAPGSGWLTLRQRVAANWTVNQVWRLGTASPDASVISGNRLIRAMGEGADKMPVPRNAADWKRTRVPSNGNASGMV